MEAAHSPQGSASTRTGPERVTGIARLYGLDKDVQVAAELPTSITVADAERYRDMADAATADNLSKPKLSKGA